MTAEGPGIEVLRRVPLFSGLSDERFAWLAERAQPVELEAGQALLAEGEAADAMFVVVDGLLEASKVEGGREARLGVYGPGEPLGELALLARRPRSATVRALAPSRLLCIGEQTFAELLDIPSVARQILEVVLSRLATQEALLRQNAKMAALGTLTAGLLHDLNNPAAAVRANVRRLGEALGEWRPLSVDLGRSGPEVTAAVDGLRGAGGEPPPGGSLEHSDREEELLAWLQGQRVADAYQLAPALAGSGLTSADLERHAAGLPAGELGLVVRWLALDGEVERLLADTGRGADHIAEVTRRSKNYSRLDQAPAADVDVHDGLETVLALLRSKLRGVRVRREFDADLPRIEAYPANLNEVWLNLVDNALDALEGGGELVLRTVRAPDGGVTVEIADDGPGIPADVRERIFDPFFTTKPPGAGSGLGLAQVHRIVVTEHGGSVEVGGGEGGKGTRFTVTLPARLPPGLGERPVRKGAGRMRILDA